jgi:hypothetical protein
MTGTISIRYKYLVLRSLPRPPPQREVVPQSLVEPLPLATLTLERVPARAPARARARAATPGAVRTYRISGISSTRLRSV